MVFMFVYTISIPVGDDWLRLEVIIELTLAIEVVVIIVDTIYNILFHECSSISY